MNNLESQLLKNSEKTLKDSGQILDEAKLLLSSNAAEEINTLNSIGLNQELRYVTDIKQDLIIRKSAKEKLEKEVVHINDIKALCLNYRLYMRPAKEYMGTIPPDLGAELTRFCKEKNIALPSHADYSKFFIIAPPKMFRGYLSPIGVVGAAMDIAIENERERIRKKNEDPILVYETERDYYAVVKSWGNDFTPLRRAYGFFTRKLTMKWLNFLGALFTIYGVYKLIILQFGYFAGKSNAWALAHKGQHHEGWLIVATLISIMLVIVLVLWFAIDPFTDFRKQIIRLVTQRNEPRL